MLSLLGRTPSRLCSGSGPEIPAPPTLKRHHCFLWAPYGPDRMGGDRGGPHCTCRLDGMLARPRHLHLLPHIRGLKVQVTEKCSRMCGEPVTSFGNTEHMAWLLWLSQRVFDRNPRREGLFLGRSGSRAHATETGREKSTSPL